MEYMIGVSQNWVANALAALTVALIALWKSKKWMTPKMDDVKTQERTVAAILIAPFVAAPLFVLMFVFFLSMLIDFMNLPEPLARRELLQFVLILGATGGAAYSAVIMLTNAYRGVMIVVRRRH